MDVEDFNEDFRVGSESKREVDRPRWMDPKCLVPDPSTSGGRWRCKVYLSHPSQRVCPHAVRSAVMKMETLYTNRWLLVRSTGLGTDEIHVKEKYKTTGHSGHLVQFPKGSLDSRKTKNFFYVKKDFFNVDLSFFIWLIIMDVKE